jgi:hypothetical protein
MVARAALPVNDGFAAAKSGAQERVIDRQRTPRKKLGKQ